MNKKPPYSAGEVIGNLTIIKSLGVLPYKKSGNHMTSLVKCFCGKEFQARDYDLRKGRCMSCGCAKKPSHFVHGGRKTMPHLYKMWENMKARCKYDIPKNKDYAGRGIKVCSEWQYDFIAFKKYAIENGYKIGYLIDRINVNGNYEPGNVRFIPFSDQAENRRNTFLITFNGITQSLSKWAKETGIERTALRARICNLGWPIEKALMVKHITKETTTK